MKIIIAEDKPQATTELKETRLSICIPCSFYDNGVCQSCNCVVERKILYDEAACPEGKW
jgi:hypothetical protein